jgi:hypothetical protein
MNRMGKEKKFLDRMNRMSKIIEGMKNVFH